MKDGVYDALFVAANACSNNRSLTALRSQRDSTIKEFLEAGKGLYIGHQAKIHENPSFGFLPEIFDLTTIVRPRAEERTTDADLKIVSSEAQHPIVTFPRKVDVRAIMSQCVNNNLVEGVYWDYLKPGSEGAYQPLLVDAKYEPQRDILVVSRTDLTPRIVISTLVVEWQGHDTLWENLVRYVVEGRPSLAVVSKLGTSSNNFRYLTSTIDVKKLPSAKYSFRSLDELKKVSVGPHDALIFDPAWPEKEVLDYYKGLLGTADTGISRIYFFSSTPQGDVIVNSISRFKEFNRISRNALTWLTSLRSESNQAYWGGSFWTTIDVLATLQEFGYPIKQYERILKAELQKHDIDGSYDEVLGPTCGLLEVYFWLYGKEDARYSRTLDWILSHMSGKTLYERASALETIVRLGETVEPHKLAEFKNEVVSVQSEAQNEFVIHRYVRCLLTCGFSSEAQMFALKLVTLQNKSDGGWINVSNTAATTLTLIRLQSAALKPDHDIDEMIFRGIQFIKSTYSEAKWSWENDPLATALALRALRQFEQLVTFPIDELLFSLQGVNKEARSLIAIEAATKQNMKLLQDLNDMSQQCDTGLTALNSSLEKERRDSKFSKILSVVAVGFMMVGLSVGMWLLKYLINNHKLTNVFAVGAAFLSQTSVELISTLAIVPLLCVTLLLAKFDWLPKALKAILEKIIGSKE
jgi:hypothetical protein